jgi:hypothetical protein
MEWFGPPPESGDGPNDAYDAELRDLVPQLLQLVGGREELSGQLDQLQRPDHSRPPVGDCW